MDVTPSEFVDRLLKDGFEEPTDECQASELVLDYPSWHDDHKFKRGQKFYRDNIYGMMATNLIGLITIIAVPSTLKVLVKSKRSSSTFTAYRRYASTTFHVMSWNYDDFKPNSKMWKSLLAVRARHLHANKMAKKLGAGFISQADVALTQFAFVAHSVLYPDNFGLQAFDKDSWDSFIHVWRTIAFMLGLQDKYNICIGTIEETTEICRILMQRVFAPLLEFPPEPYEHMAVSIMDGIWSVLPLSDPKAGLYMARLLAGVPGYVYTEQDLIDFRRKLKSGEITTTVEQAKSEWHETRPRQAFNIDNFYRLQDVPEYKNFNFVERYKMNTTSLLSKLYATYLGHVLLNAMIRVLIFLTEYFPVLAFIRFGYTRSFVDMFVESIGDKTEPLSNAEVREALRRKPWYSGLYS